MAEAKAPQPQKQSLPMIVTDLGIVMEVKALHDLKQLFSIVLTLWGMSMAVKLVQSLKVCDFNSCMDSESFTETRPEQSLKHSAPIVSTELGSFTEVNSLQPLKLCPSTPTTE